MLKNFWSGTYHAVSGKHLPRYLAEFNYRVNRRYDLAAMLPRLGYVEVRSLAITQPTTLLVFLSVFSVTTPVT